MGLSFCPPTSTSASIRTVTDTDAVEGWARRRETYVGWCGKVGKKTQIATMAGWRTQLIRHVRRGRWTNATDGAKRCEDMHAVLERKKDQEPSANVT